MHLRPAGDAGLHAVAQHVARDLVLELAHERRPLGARADDRHVAGEHVPDLRQLVERPRAQELADARAARIVLDRPHRTARRFGVDAHRAELHDHERAAVEPHALLAVEDGAAVLDPDGERDQRQDGQQHDQRGERDRQIHRPLHHAVPTLERHLREVDHRRAVDVLQRGLDGGVLEDVGHQLDLDALAGHEVEELEDLLVRLQRQREEDLIDALRRQYLFRLLRGAEHGHAADHRALLAGIVIQEADHLEAHLAVSEDLGGDLAAQQPGAHDENALQVVPRAAHAPQHRARHHARGGDEREIHQREEAQEGAAVGEVLGAAGRRRRAVPGDHHREQHGGEEDREDDGEHLVDAAAPPPALVEAVEVEDHRPEDEDDRHQAQIRAELRHVLGDRDDLDLETQQPGGEERCERRREIGEEIESGRLPVAFLDQRCGTLS